MMEEEIRQSPQQFAWTPRIEQGEGFVRKPVLIAAGMGGSLHPVGFLRMKLPTHLIIEHRDYGLPDISKEIAMQSMVVVISYSGNTEEALDSLEEVRHRGLPVVVVSVGGKLLEMALAHQIPFIRIPDTHIQPRMATGFILRALLFILGEEEALHESDQLVQVLDINRAEQEGRLLAEKIKNHIPLVYASRRNFPVAHLWKIKFNETGKIPSFCNMFPELNHNETTGFDATESARTLSEKFHFIFLEDTTDHERVKKRMQISRDLLMEKGFPVEMILLDGATLFEKIFRSLLVADCTSVAVAHAYGADPEAVPLVEEFKKRIVQ